MHKTKPISSPTRAEPFAFPPPLTTFLRTNFGSKSTRRKSSRLIFRRRRRLTGELTPQAAEPSSPKVTCIGQVRSRKTTPSRRYGIRVSKSPVFFRCRWVVGVKRGMLCFSKHCRKLTRRSVSAVRNWVSCRGQQEAINRQENRSEREEGESKSEIEARPPSAADVAAAEEEGSNDPSASPPRNALLLTRCRSASSVGTTTTRFWSSPSTSKEESGDEEDEEIESSSTTAHVREDSATSGNEPKQRDSTAESRRDPESLKLRENRGGCEKVQLVVALVAGDENESSVGIGIRNAVLKRCKSEPGRVMERLVSDPELDLRRRRKSGFDISTVLVG